MSGIDPLRRAPEARGEVTPSSTPAPKKIQVHFQIPEDQWAKFKKWLARSGYSASFFFRKKVREALGEEIAIEHKVEAYGKAQISEDVLERQKGPEPETYERPVAETGAEELIYIRYKDHVLYHRGDPVVMAPQIRETIGWLVHEAPDYVIISWDRDAGPPTLKGGDPKASGLVILRTDILEMRRV